MPRILVLHGPNLNLLGARQPEVYGRTTLSEIDHALREAALARGAEVKTLQSNSEGTLIDAVHDARTSADGIITNVRRGTYSPPDTST